MAKLTAKKLDSMQGKRRPSAVRLWDGDGFGAKVSAAGGITFFQFYYAPAGTLDEGGNDISGRRRFYSLGAYGKEYGLAQARLDAAAIRTQVKEHKHDPQEQERIEREEQRRARKQAAQRGSMASLLALLIRHYRKKGRARRYILDTRRAWHRDVFPVIDRATKAADVTPEDVRRVLHRPLARGSDHSARTLRATLHLAFKMGMRADLDPRSLASFVRYNIKSNPVEDVPVDATVTPGERELSFAEIGTLWRNIDKTAPAMDALLIRLLLAFGGQHITELREAQWHEFDLAEGRWLLSASRHKNRTRDHLLPIPPTAAKLLQELKLLTGGKGYLFPQVRKPHKPMNVERPAQIIRDFLEAQQATGEPLDKFTCADFRRTCKTRMHEIGVTRQITNHLHNHDFGGVSAKHYDRWDYWDEKQKAMQAWDMALQAAINGNSVPVARCRSAMQWRAQA